MKKKHGFTLIELLIVVAIIAILAAIAIPNFLAAQVRSKVSRSKTELRTIATALESYMVDNTTYPVNNSGGSNGVFGGDLANAGYVFMITTPIAYITSYPKDPFAVGVQFPASGQGYFFYTYNEREPSPSGWQPFYAISFANHFAILSFGPDLLPGGLVPGGSTGLVPWTSMRTTGSENATLARAYDPSNGTVSYGEIYRTQISGQIN